MNMLISFFQKLRTNIFYQVILFGTLGLLAFYKIFSFWFYHGWETSWFGSLAQKVSLLEVMKTHGLISYINYSFFGWRPVGWFATALIFHIASALIINLFISRKTNKTIGLVAGLLFLITTAHHDVVTWGTFESLYAVQTICFYAGLWSYDLYMTSKRFVWYVAMVSGFLVSLLIRESGLLFIPIVFFFDLFFHAKLFKNKPKQWLKILIPVVRRHVMLWIIGIGYLILRASYGGSANDFIDERVQFSILLLNEHRYVEYFIRGLLSFGYFIGPYLIPYPIINFLRDIVLSILPSSLIKIYFFTFFGWVCYALFFYTVYQLRKSVYSAYVWFCFASFTAVTLFYSFAWSVKDSFLATEYFWSENRWRYLAFSFFAAGVSILAYKFFATTNLRSDKRWWRRPTFGIVFLGLYLAVNTLFLNGIEDKMYRENSLPSKLFYQTFLREFPTLTNKDTFYAFPGSLGLGDFFTELKTTSSTYYSNLTQREEPWFRTELYYILKGMQNKEPWTEHVNFVDFDMAHGSRNHTEQVRSIFSQLTPVNLEVVQKAGSISANISSAPPVDFRYDIIINYRASPINITVNTEKTLAVETFSAKLAAMSSGVDIEVCKTVGYPTEPNFDFRKELALDGNISYRSFWWADCRPAWIVVDMGSQTTFSGAAWASVSKPDSVPREYHYDVSEDGKIWIDVQSVIQNTKNSRIDVFPEPVKGRYLRFWVDETAYRQLLAVNEFVPLFPETVSVAKFYSGLPELYSDMYSLAVRAPWVKVAWTTAPDNNVSDEDRSIYVPIINDGEWHMNRFAIPESDYFSSQSQFLKRNLTGITFTVRDNVSLNLDKVQVFSPFTANR